MQIDVRLQDKTVWLSQRQIAEKVTYETFFRRAKLDPNADLIAGIIYGYKIEGVENLLTKQARYLDKLIEEPAKGKKILRVA